MSNVVSLIAHTNDGRHWSAADVLGEALEYVETHEINPRIAILVLDDKNGMYDLDWFSAGVDNAQFLAMLEVAAHKIKNELAPPPVEWE